VIKRFRRGIRRRNMEDIAREAVMLSQFDHPAVIVRIPDPPYHQSCPIRRSCRTPGLPFVRIRPVCYNLEEYGRSG
jgi:hypothetical protein